MKKLFAIILFIIVTFLATAAHSQRAAGRDAIILARICAHEAGWNADLSGDCAAIHEVLWRGAMREEMSYRSFAYAYSGRALRGETSRRYFAELDATGRQPSSWPRYETISREGGIAHLREVPSFSRYRSSWLRLVSHAEQIIAMHPDDVSPCASDVHDWGGSMDRDRARRLGLIQIDCGDTRNDFYARPSQIEETVTVLP